MTARRLDSNRRSLKCERRTFINTCVGASVRGGAEFWNADLLRSILLLHLAVLIHLFLRGGAFEHARQKAVHCGECSHPVDHRRTIEPRK